MAVAAIIVFIVSFVLVITDGSGISFALFIASIAGVAVSLAIAKFALRKVPGHVGAPSNPTLDIPESDEVVIAYGYDYLTESYKIWMSPIVHLPSTRSRMDTYLSVVEVTQREYTSRQESFPDVENTVERLQGVGWKVKEVHPVELLKHLPYWVSESGGPKIGRAANMDEENNSGSKWDLRYHTDESDAPLRDDLKAKVRELERQAREDAEFKEVTKPLPDWVSHLTIAGSKVDALNAVEDFHLSDIEDYVIFYDGMMPLSDFLSVSYTHGSAGNLDWCNAWLFEDRSVLLYNPSSSDILWSEGDKDVSDAMIGYANFVLDEMETMAQDWDVPSIASSNQDRLYGGQDFAPSGYVVAIKADEGVLDPETQIAYLYMDGSVLEQTAGHYSEVLYDRKDRILDAMRQKLRRLDSINR